LRDFNFRFVVLTCVSTEQQAIEGRESLPHQLRTAKEYGEQNGGIFIREYRADGYSRTGYYDLTKAFNDAPPLGELARDATQDTFDVVLLESYDRLGDLGFMLWNFLKPYRKQLRSVQQTLPIMDPSKYDPRQDDITPTMLNNSANTNVYRIHKINRAFAVGNRRRAQDGKYTTKIPYGYIKVDKDTVKLDDNVAALLVNFPRWFLRGDSYSSIVERANASGIPTREGYKWRDSGIKYILRNPFYAGKTSYDKGDWIKGNYIIKPDAEFHDGNHEPLWDWDTFHKITAEFDRRRTTRTVKQDYNLTGLIQCSECDEKLHISYSNSRPTPRYWRCENKHVNINADRANEMVADEIIRLYADHEIIEPTPEKVRDFSRRGLIELNRWEAKLTDTFRTTDAYTPDAYADEMRKIRSRRAELENEQRQLEEAQSKANDRRETISTVRELVPYIHQWIGEEKPSLVKYILSKTVTLTAYPDKTIKADSIPHT
jgi:hypothetical protein